MKENKTIGKYVTNLALATGLAATIMTAQGCAGSCSNTINDISRDAIKRDYEVTLFANNGSIIMKDTLSRTFIEVSEHGSGLRYLKNGKMVMLNGTYILEEK